MTEKEAFEETVHTMNAPRLEVAGAWQPISTAPTDGTRVLTYGCLHDDGGADMGEVPAVQLSRYDRQYGWWCAEWGSHEPTYWQPLPTPPTPPPLVETEEGKG